MRKPMRYLRIAFSAVCGLASVLLIILWVYSYWWVEQIVFRVSANRCIGIGIGPGDIGIGTSVQTNVTTGFRITQSAEKWLDSVAKSGQHHSRIWGQFNLEPAIFPFWFLVALSILLAIVPWIPVKRFSLR